MYIFILIYSFYIIFSDFSIVQPHLSSYQTRPLPQAVPAWQFSFKLVPVALDWHRTIIWGTSSDPLRLCSQYRRGNQKRRKWRESTMHGTSMCPTATTAATALSGIDFCSFPKSRISDWPTAAGATGSAGTASESVPRLLSISPFLCGESMMSA